MATSGNNKTPGTKTRQLPRSKADKAAPIDVASSVLPALRECIDGLDPHLHWSIAERAQFAGHVGKAKGMSAAEVLSPFARHGLGMNRIGSPPGHAGRWRYAFFVDVQCHVQADAMRAAMDDLPNVAHRVAVLGSCRVAIP